MMSEKIKHAARTHHVHSQSSIDPLAHTYMRMHMGLKKEYKLEGGSWSDYREYTDC